MISAHMLNKTCSVNRPTVSKGASGAIGVSAYSILYENIPCALQVDSSSNTLQYRMERNVRAATLYIRPTTSAGTVVTVTTDYQVIVDSETWNVVGPSYDASGGRGILLRIPLEAPI